MYMKNPVNDVNTSYFSEAELRVVKLLASGSSEKEIADRLCISRHTVDNHLRNIRENSACIRIRRLYFCTLHN